MGKNTVNMETEAKVRVDRFDAVVERLEQNDAVFVDEVMETDTYYDDKCCRLLTAGCGLRLRRREGRKGEQILLTFKGPVRESIYKSRPEAQTAVSDLEEMTRILEGLGYRPLIVVEKTRRIWRLGECEVCLDDVAELGRFVEIEGPSETEIETALRLLNLDTLEPVRRGYARLLAESRGKTPPDQARKE
jgi:adenylate cyclase class 2